MFNKFSNFIFGKKKEVREKEKPREELPGKSKEVRQGNKLNAVDLLFSSIKGIGHPQYPILDRQYSPGSRIPCTDLIPFISGRIIEGDFVGIKAIMQAVVEGNPGLGIGAGWIEESIDNILAIPFEKYVSFQSAKALPELKAFFIIAAKGGGDREFLIAEGLPQLISWGCVAYCPVWTDQLHFLSKRANSWIAKMAKDAPYWKDYEEFIIKEIPNAYIDDELRSVVLTLSPAARLQLFYTVLRGGGDLHSLTDYQIRSLGINVDETSRELVDSTLLSPSYSKETVLSAFSKQELVELCDKYGAAYKKSWKKEKLVDSLQKMDSEILKEVSESKCLVSPNYIKYPGLRNVVGIADEHQIGFTLLCFA